ncbi:UDP-N-acetylglucosamine diphosphorylase [Eubacteriales bacterium KG127]
MSYMDYQDKKESNKKIIIQHMDKGVEFLDIDTVWIDPQVKIGKGTKIEPCVQLKGKTTIGEGCLIGQNSRIENSTISDDVTVLSSVILESKVGNKTSVGPFAYIRPESDIGSLCKVGDFVEIKNSTLGDGTKASHLTYIGDADLGNDINLGCGVVFVNYDGTNKHRSTVEDGAFIGCNANLVSPVKVKKGAYVAAGTTVTTDVPEDALCVGRTKQKVIEGWAEKRGLYRKNK